MATCYKLVLEFSRDGCILGLVEPKEAACARLDQLTELIVSPRDRQPHLGRSTSTQPASSAPTEPRLATRASLDTSTLHSPLLATGPHALSQSALFRTLGGEHSANQTQDSIEMANKRSSLKFDAEFRTSTEMYSGDGTSVDILSAPIEVRVRLTLRARLSNYI